MTITKAQARCILRQWFSAPDASKTNDLLFKLKAGGFELRPSKRPQHSSKTLTCDRPLLCFYMSPLDQKATRVSTRIPCGLLEDWSHPFELGPRGSACGNPSSRAAFGRIHHPDSCNPSHLNCRSGHRRQDCCRRSHSSSSVAMTERSTTARDSRRTCPPASGPIQARRSSLRPDVRVRLLRGGERPGSNNEPAHEPAMPRALVCRPAVAACRYAGVQIRHTYFHYVGSGTAGTIRVSADFHPLLRYF